MPKSTRTPRRSPRRSRPRTRSSSRCPTSARRSGTGRTRPGSSRRSCSPRALAGYATFDPALRLPLQLVLRSGRSAASACRTRACCPGPASRRSRATAQHVDGAMHDADRLDATPTRRALVELGLHHEQQHQELLLMDIKHVLSMQPVATRVYATPDVDVPRRRAAPRLRRRIRAASSRSGTTATGFAFDNESPAPRRVPRAVPRSPTGSSPRGEWLAFIDDGGYRRPELWLSDGWDARADAASGKRRSTGERRRRRLAGVHPRRAAPASTRRAGRAREPLRGRRVRALGAARGSRPRSSGSTRSRVARRRGDARASVRRRRWQWTASAYLPYPRFRPAAGAVGEYNGKFMSQPDGAARRRVRHARRATPARRTATSSRRRARWAFSGAPPRARRLATSVSGPRGIP